MQCAKKIIIKKYNFVKIWLSKLGHTSLIVRKRLIGEEKDALHQKMREIAGCVFNWYKQKYTFLSENYVFELKLLKDCSGYQQLHLINMSIPTFHVIYLPWQDKQKFRIKYKFPYVHYQYENKLLSVCLSCYLRVDSVVHDSSKQFIRYYTEGKKMIETFQILL